MAGKVRIATRLGADVNARLRALAYLRDEHLSDVLTDLLDKVLPPADELRLQLPEKVSA